MSNNEKGVEVGFDENGHLYMEVRGNICCACFKDLVEGEDGRLVCPDLCP